MRTLIIDNYDSFTFNLFQYVAAISGIDPMVVRNDELSWDAITKIDPDCVIISPGPGRPERARDFGISADVIANAAVPVLGVCLGHQGIAHYFGGRIQPAQEPMHGRSSEIFHDGTGLFADTPSPFRAVRYHSLIVGEPLPAELEKLAWTSDGSIMALKHQLRPLWGVQFHPESICTEHGKRLLANFLRMAEKDRPVCSGSKRTRATTASTPGSPPALAKSDPAIRVLRIEAYPNAESLFVSEFARSANSFWLDSSMVTAGLSRFSFMGDDQGPHSELLRYDSRSRQLTATRKDQDPVAHSRSIFEYLGQSLRQHATDGAGLPFDFQGGFVGYFGYELKNEFAPAAAPHVAPSPDACFLFADRFVAIDHLEKCAYLIQVGPETHGKAADSWEKQLEAAIKREASARAVAAPVDIKNQAMPVRFTMRHDKTAYLKLIHRCKDAIRNGESYEICLTNTLTTESAVDPLALYLALRAINPAPYGAYLKFGDLSILSSSPERFLKIEPAGAIEAKPIKGTAPRGATLIEDARLAETLRSSEKNKAENLMIVDLLRNDLGSICEIGSVEVSKLMDIETYANVHQMVSTVRGRLGEGLGAVDAVRAAFPGGSMTGAPKLRTIELIDSFENSARGVYSGALGFLSLSGSADLSVVIRTIVAGPDGLSIGAGGAILALSDENEEFEEMLLKARAPLGAIARAVTGREDAYFIAGLD